MYSDTNFCATCLWIPSLYHQGVMGILFHIARHSGCKVHLAARSPITALGLRTLTFVVFASSMEALQLFVSDAKSQTTWVDWEFTNCNPDVYGETGMEAMPPFILNSLADSIYMTCLENDRLKKELDL